jgi:hypothetical protein
MNIRDLDSFRAALLVILLAGLIVAAWHVSWLHKHNRYQMELTDRPGVVFVLDQHQGTLYFAREHEILNGWTDVWRAAPSLPQP